MRFLVPIVVLLVTFFLLPRPGEEGVETAGAATHVQNEQPTIGIDDTNLPNEAAGYDDAVEAAGVLNRLDLLNF